MSDQTVKKNPKKPKRKFRWLRRLLRTIAGIIIFFLLLILFIRSPWGQDIIVNQAVNYLEGKTGTEVQVESLYFTFDGDISASGVYLEDLAGDTLVYSKKLEADIPFLPWIRGGSLSIDNVEWEGLVARIKRKDTVQGFNFQFLADAFATAPDTTASEPMQLDLGNFDLNDFDVIYDDKVTGMFADARFQKLQVAMNELDLEKMRYTVDELDLTDADITYIMSEPSIQADPDTVETDSVPLPFLAAGNIKFSQVDFNFKSEIDGIELTTYVDDLETSIPKIDLDQQDYEVSFLDFRNSRVDVAMTTQDSKTTGNIDSSQAAAFEWPPLTYNVQDVLLENINFTYSVDGAQPQVGQFNPDAVFLEDVNLTLAESSLKNQTLTATIEKLNGKEASGLNLYSLNFEGEVSDSAIALSGLNLNLNRNTLNGNLSMDYASLQQLTENPTNIKVQANLPGFNIDLADVYRFQPDLKQQPYFDALTKHRLRGNLIATGSTDFLNIPKLNLDWGQATYIYATGNLRNVTDPEALSYNFGRVRVNSKRKDLIAFVDEQALGVELPQDVQLVGSFNGTTTSLKTDAQLQTSLGAVDADGTFAFGENINFDAVVRATEIQLSTLLQNPSLGDLTLNLDVEGSGSTINELDATLEGNLSKFAYNGYQINNVPLSAKIKDGQGTFDTKFRDDNLDLELDAFVDLDSVATEAQATINVKGIDLYEFGISSKNTKAGGKIITNFKGNLSEYEVDLEIEDGIAVYDDQSYLLGSFNAHAFSAPDTTAVDVKNRMLDLELRSNVDPAQLFAGLQRHMDRYLNREVSMDTTNYVVMKLKGKVQPAPMLREVILPGLESLDTLTLSVNFNERKRLLDTDIIIPYVKYTGSVVDSIHIQSRSDQERFDFEVGYDRLEAGPVSLAETVLKGSIIQNRLELDFVSYDEGERLLHFGSTLSRKRDQLGVDNLIFNLSIDDLIFNKKPWQIPETNEMAYGENKIKFKDFKLTDGNQSLELRSDLADIEKDHIALLMNNFRLQSVLSYLNPDEKLATGIVNGELVFEDVLGKMGFEADMSIDELHVMQTKLGRLALDTELVDGNRYNMDMTIKGKPIDLQLAGNYTAAETAAELDLQLDINRLEMNTVTGLSQDFLKEGSGSMNGKISVTGTTSEPTYNGKLEFENAGFNVAMLNNEFLLQNEELNLNNDAITFNNFEIRDENNNVFSIDGSVGTEDLFTPTFDLKLKARDFTALNSTEDDNDLYYGVAKFDADATIKGDINIPVIDMDVRVDNATDFTYVMPAAEVNMVQRDGIVQFVNKEDPDNILTQSEDVSATLTGFDLNMNLSVNDGATVNIIIDPNTSDKLQVSGSGDLIYKMFPNGRMTLTGRYEIADGYYQLNFYDIVSRRFDLAEGGSVSWTGDPFDAILDVRAIYRIETSASSLMAARTSGIDAADRNQFRQQLPFLVYLNLDGELMKPEISFAIDLPEDERGYAGGQVYGTLQQLNNQPQQLNKQVFALITLNRFFPTSGSDGSQGGVATVARDNLNQAISDQLNQYGGQLFGNTGVDLTFGLDSYTDYQGNSAQERTQLDVTASKKLLNDRLIVSVGSEVDVQGSNPDGSQTPLIGNVAIEYLITPQGRWRFKGFRRNQFDNVVDGQLMVSGVAIIFTREFNKFKNLFKSSDEFKQLEEEKSAQQTTDARMKEDDDEDQDNEDKNPDSK
ncbi:hypothetical protein BST97_03035 [Nonlabens spongiae]|uniref:Translocation and assembly module TamB C-terminal domain-containing protein n=1 Tax=Nonlabens spongiae TaxID=331648 RepID=A0A1W6MHI1_9FLAO|nr:translocation/assembly module TamB [Nonlabens spongiae]ARN77058.1 hypothetical protein BST97_03035 [Nonlabens spongiae]